MSFKIIALEILDSCDSKHSRNLVKGVPYVFYKNYKIKKENGNEIITVDSEDFDLYSKDIKSKINISAIVGKNGSGKSTVVELLIKGINNLFWLYRKQHKNRGFHTVENVKGIELNIYYKINKELFKLYVFSKKNEKHSEYKIYNYSYNTLLNGYEIREDITSSFNLKNFFYTEVINYSLYSYNSVQEGEWINHIFHKNDAYQTPVVLNPWRDNGIIDINRENDLVYQRLLSNLLRYNSKDELNLFLGDNLIAERLILTIKEQKKQVMFFDTINLKNIKIGLSGFNTVMRNDILDKLLLRFHKSELKKLNLLPKILSYSRAYVLYKLISICSKYKEYTAKKYFNFKEKRFNDLDGLINKLVTDNSHITFKLRQTLNYLVYRHIEFDIAKDSTDLQFINLAKEIKRVADKEKCDIINCLPPPIFDIDVKLKSSKSKETNILFSTLSSGEKQQIYSVNSIYYHLMNLDSVKKSTDKKKISYQYVNIMLEEIELYFHPELQRTFIETLLTGIVKLKLKNIKSINFIFVTHSPFILSDIPNNNIMYLTINDDGYFENTKERKKSFASNIHHLLGDNFFFENNVYIGELARNKIDQIIKFIKSKKNKDIEYYYELINLIDEPILKNKLSEMLFENFPEFYMQKNIEEKEMQVRNYAQQLGIDINIIKST